MARNRLLGLRTPRTAATNNPTALVNAAKFTARPQLQITAPPGRTRSIDNRLMLNCYFIDSVVFPRSLAARLRRSSRRWRRERENLTFICRRGAEMRFAEVGFAVF